MSNIDKRALREAAERAGQNDWEYVYTSDLSAPGRGYITVGGAEAIYCLNRATGGVKQSENVLRYIAAARPEKMLALLDEIAELEQRHCGTALLEREEMHTKTLGRMLDELEESERLRLKFQEANCELCQKLEAAEKRIAELEAREINLPPYSFFDFKQGSPFKSGAYCHIDSVNQELSKHGIKMTAAAGKGE
ncbi:ead/Ea22-like family protein [Enterobacter roggenkampii]|uniref:ead/Ea22-like family protein n=1 Tax=Enterobacter roggenkampii TaxID=1812935 RepID=UPI002003E08C|nr:ead/Ea22-like family protein [Enterobacter roggenkampii]MCK6652712.1 ead/Ea22-like family protein [Enterobacter roggenkampii]